ncbi:hypothetical protein [Nocardioides bruguierae]|uniref:N-acetyltransferase domain-containing protein n=1 Tax=Nocardioides bruguierae TaxID=2945102 RepID=A0A9X2IE55_9ACTN|nr:hypothetical protein [Nocardioides bruguierae]MCM0618999.1 hypothetical protein [Nocardioides bruguierae]
MSDLVLRDWAGLDAPHRDRVRQIYEDAFPPELRAPFEDLLVDRLLVAVPVPEGADHGADPVGLALVRDLGSTDWTFLRYLAIGPRGGGHGSRLVAALAALLAAEGRRVLVWDVEDPDEPGIGPEAVEEHRRRIVFYERAGGVLLPVREYAPPHGDELDGHAPSLRLMALPLTDAGLPAVRDLLVGVMTLRYELGVDHPAVLAPLATLEE